MSEFMYYMIGGVPLLLCSIFSFVVVARMLRHRETVLGLLTAALTLAFGVGAIVALLLGWKNRTAWNLTKIMPIFAACVLVWLALNVLGYGVWNPLFYERLERSQRQAVQIESSPIEGFENLRPKSMNGP